MPNYDWSGLGNSLTHLGQSIGEGRKHRRLEEALGSLGPGATHEDYARVLLQAGEPEAALKFKAAGMKSAREPKWKYAPDGVTPYDENADTAPPIVAPKAKPTAAENAIDTNFGKEYVDWTSNGGAVGAEKNVGQIEEAAHILEQKPGITGSMPGTYAGTGIESWLNPKGVELRGQVEESIQGSLKQVLGGQFAQKEADNLFKRVYDPSLPDEANAISLRRFSKRIRLAAKDKEAQIKYYEEHGSLKGFKSRPINFERFYPPEKLPKDKSELKKNKTYLAPDGRVGVWDGDSFQPSEEEE